nr:hypothetical protein [Tanacetum cinerariifolium]GFA00065.1 hypothetical protein [Tanacetum cinerariifolium]
STVLSCDGDITFDSRSDGVGNTCFNATFNALSPIGYAPVGIRLKTVNPPEDAETQVRNFAAMADLSLRLFVSWRGRQAYASSMPHILSLPLSMACDDGDGHGSQTLIPNVSRTSSFVITLVGAAVAGQGWLDTLCWCFVNVCLALCDCTLFSILIYLLWAIKILQHFGLTDRRD